MLQTFCAVLLAIALALAAIGVTGTRGPRVHRLAMRGGYVVYLHDGRPLRQRGAERVRGGSAEPGYDYACERVGLMGTQTDHGRVRYRGTLQDPNELALAVGIALPSRSRSSTGGALSRLLLAWLATAAIGLCITFTQSRGGQLVFVAVLAVYFVNRLRRETRLPRRDAARPSAHLLRRTERGEGAASTMERIECWWSGCTSSWGRPPSAWGTDSSPSTTTSRPTTASCRWGRARAPRPAALELDRLSGAEDLPQGPEGEAGARRAHLALALLASTIGLVVGASSSPTPTRTSFCSNIGLTEHCTRPSGGTIRASRSGSASATWPLVALGDAVLLTALVGYTGSKMGW